jgi:hypothetical protein
MKPDRIQEILDRFSSLPDSAYVSVPVAAAHDNVDERTVRRRYPLVKLTDRKVGVNVRFLRTRQRPSAS